jgi:hypothetical protein
MKTALRTVLGVVAGVALAFVLVIAVELFSAVVHPLPPGFAGTMDEMCLHVARYPDWVLGVVVLAWSATTFVSTWGRQTDWKSIGGRRGDRRLNDCDRIQRLQAAVRDVVQSRNAELFSCGVLPGRRTQSREVLAWGRVESRVAC